MNDFLNYIYEYFDLLFLSLGLLILLALGTRIDKTKKRILISIAISVIVLSIFEWVEMFFNEYRMQYENIPRYLFSSITYSLRPVVIVLFFHIRFNFNRKREILIWIPALINFIIFSLALFAYKNPSMRLVYWFSEDNMFHREWLGYCVHVVSGLYLISLVTLSIIETTKNKKSKQINIIVLLSVLIAVFAQALAFALDAITTYTSDAYIIGAIIYYMYLSYESAYKEATMHEREMQEKNTQLMLSQIQPHFIYNTLATIEVLCDIDPKLAGETINDFSKYLRMHTDALSKQEPVLITDEIKHAEAYSKIEMLRFDNIKVLFDIKDNNFKLPVLTIQPLVENAIKYGVRGKDEGIVEIKTYFENNKHVLVIKDNGKGFDINSINDDGRNHVGINNVKTRIINMVNGTFNIDSKIDVGTTITITIPEEK